LNLVLGIERADAGLDVIIGISGRLPERDGDAHRRVRKRRQECSGRIVEVACVAEIIGGLSSEFRAREKSVADAAGREGPGNVGLIEDVQSLGRVVVRAE
jgi:hypothetical protein